MLRLPHQSHSDQAKAIANRLCEWLEATTSYVDLKEGLDRNWPNYAGIDDDKPKWNRFYQFGPVLVPDESLLDADGKATKLKIDIVAVNRDKKVVPGEIIESLSTKRTNGERTRYMVLPTGSLRRI